MTELGTFVKSGLSSVAALGVEVGLIAGLGALAVPAAVAFAGVQLAGTTITFLLNKFWAFDAGGSGKTRREFVRSAVVFAGSLTGNTALPSVLAYGFGVPPVAAFLASQVVVYAGWNYPAKRWWVFA